MKKRTVTEELDMMLDSIAKLNQRGLLTEDLNLQPRQMNIGSVIPPDKAEKLMRLIQYDQGGSQGEMSMEGTNLLQELKQLLMKYPNF
jgi:hypothetical protein